MSVVNDICMLAKVQLKVKMFIQINDGFEQQIGFDNGNVTSLQLSGNRLEVFQCLLVILNVPLLCSGSNQFAKFIVILIDSGQKSFETCKHVWSTCPLSEVSLEWVQ
jgi:hypothetical protein